MTPSPNRRLTSHRADFAGSRRHLPTERWGWHLGPAHRWEGPSINTFFTEVAEKIENKHQTDYNKTYDEDNAMLSQTAPTDTLAHQETGTSVTIRMMDFDKEAEKSRSYASMADFYHCLRSCGPSEINSDGTTGDREIMA
jgi:hypothetical protein